MITRRNSGLSLIELIVACGIATVILIATSQVMISSQEALQLTAVEADLAAQALSVIDRIANDLKDAKSSTISPGDSGGHNTISFQRCLGYGASSMILGNTIKYEMFNDVKHDLVLCRRTENGEIQDLTDALFQLEFRGRYGDQIAAAAIQSQTGTAPAYDTWEVTVHLQRATYGITRKTTVELRNRGY